MPAGPPPISVVLPTHNRQQYLAESIESILNQTFADFELIIVDDASTNPKHAQLLKQYAQRDDRIRLLRLKGNLGAAGARNKGVREARGAYIAFQDDDDVAVPQRLQTQLAFLQQHPDCALVGGRKAVCDEQLTVLRLGPPESLYMQPVMPPLDGIVRLMSANADPAALVRRECLLAVGGCRPWFKFVEDWDLTLRLQEKYPMASLPETMMYYRRHKQKQRSNSLLSWPYTVAAFVCCARRRAGQAEPIGSKVAGHALIPLLSELPAETQQALLDIRYRDLRNLLNQGQTQTAVAVLNEILLAQNLEPGLSIRKALGICRSRLTERKAKQRLGSIQRKLLWHYVRRLNPGYWATPRP